MLATIHPSIPVDYHPSAYAPHRASPLSTRSPNMPSDVVFDAGSSSSSCAAPDTAGTPPPPSLSSPSSSRAQSIWSSALTPKPCAAAHLDPGTGPVNRRSDEKTAFAKRPYKPIPPPIFSSSSSRAVRSRGITTPGRGSNGRRGEDDGARGGSGSSSQEKRREIFLNRVKRDRDESRWRARGGDDEMMRSMYVLERRRWEEGQERFSRLVQPSWEQELDLWMNVDDNQDNEGGEEMQGEDEALPLLPDDDPAQYPSVHSNPYQYPTSSTTNTGHDQTNPPLLTAPGPSTSSRNGRAGDTVMFGSDDYDYGDYDDVFRQVLLSQEGPGADAHEMGMGMGMGSGGGGNSNEMGMGTGMGMGMVSGGGGNSNEMGMGNMMDTSNG